MASKTPLLQPAQGSSAWNEPLNANFQTVTNALGNILSVSASSGYAFTSDDTVNLGFILTGSLGSGQNVTIPNNIVGSWIVVNSTSGTGSVTFKTVSGTGVQLSSGATILYSDGTNVYSAIAGSGASYLPTSGGTISGNLTVTGDTVLQGTTTLGNTTVPAGKTFTIASGATFALSGAFSPSFIAIGGNQVSPYLLTLTGLAAGGSMAYMNGLVTIPSGSGNGLQVGTTDGLGTDKLLVNGTSTFKGNMAIFNGYGITINQGGSSSGTNRLAVTGDASISGALSVGTFAPSAVSATGVISTTSSAIPAISALNGRITSSTMQSNSDAYFNNGIYLNNNGSVQTSMRLYGSAGSVNINYLGASAFSFNSPTGQAYASGSTPGWLTVSDANLKKDITKIDAALELVKGMRGVYFKFKTGDELCAGVIAQEMQQVAPMLVSKMEDNLSVNYPHISAFLIEAIKELSSKVETLEARIAALEAKTS